MAGAGAAQDEEAGGIVGPVDQDAQQLKKPFAALHFVDDDQPSERRQRERGVGKPRRVGWVLQVEYGDRRRLLGDQVTGKRRLADLSGANQAHDGELLQQVLNCGLVLGAGYHAPNYTGKS